MALTGLEIYKHLPKTNCKACGVPTCLAFAMKVAAKQAGLDQCPHMTAAARAALAAASAPPQRLVKLGEGETAVEVGQETVLFRHEETFHHPTGVAIRVSDKLSAADVAARCKAISELRFERVGTVIKADMVAVANDSGDAGKFKAACEAVAGALKLPAVLISDSVDALKAAASGPYKGKRPLLCGATAANLDAAAALAKECACPLCITEPDLEKLAAMTEKVKGVCADLVLSCGRRPAAEALEFLTRTRRAALKANFRALGYPVLAIPDSTGIQATVDAAIFVLKYAGVVVVDSVSKPDVLGILTTRQNVYTDPRKPVQVEAKVYEINDPGPDAPLLVTTNFSLSYYSVEGEVDASRVPARILAVDTEGTSVLTAWAADKFTPETIAAALKKSGLEGKLSHKTVVIPGHVAVISAGLEDESGWKVVVGPKEASGIGPMLKSK